MKIDLTYHYLTHHVVPGPQSFSYFIPLILLPISLLIPRTILSKWRNVCIFLPIMVAATAHAWYVMDGTDVISADVLFQALFFLVFQDPWTKYEYVPPPIEDEKQLAGKHDASPPADGRDEQDESNEQTPLKSPETITSSGSATKASGQIYPSAVRQRIVWVLKLLSCIRLNNWRIGHRAHDAAQPPAPAFRTRKRFLAQAILSVLRGYLVLDLTRAYIEHDAYFTDTSIPITAPLPLFTNNDKTATLNSSPAIAQFTRSILIGAQAWALISQMFYLPALLPVGLNYISLLPATWSPHTWSPFFGPASAILTSGVRGFWGQYWHQTMRWMTAGPGYALVDALGVRRGGVVRYGIISTSAFLLSGVTHMGLVPPEPKYATVDVNWVRVLMAGFFWVQPVGMMVEVVVEQIARRVLPTSVRHSRQIEGLRVVVNALGVLLWFALCMPLLGEAGRQLGYWRVWPMPVSVWRGLRGEGWVTWPFLLG